MSPVSRTRKTKKSKTSSDTRGAARRRTQGALTSSPMSAFAALVGPRQRPEWFDPSIKAVLEGADVIMAARGPRELEQATAELLGAELHCAVHEERKGLWFSWWFEELTEAAAARIREQVASRDGGWVPPWRLLHGLTSIGSPALRSIAQTALQQVSKELRGDAALRQQPDWLRLLARITATGEVWEMRDAYGARIALIVGFSYPRGVDRSVFLFDIDACGFVEIAHAGVFDNVAQAVTAWRALVGETAAQGSRPERVETAERLRCLAHCDSDEEILRGSESRTVLDNWFRARRRIHDVADALRKRGMSLPAARSLYHDLDTDPMANAFTSWYAQRHGIEPDSEVVDALEWMEGTLPDTWHAASPHRVDFQLALINDWIPDDPVTIAAKALLPEWVRWHGEHADLPEHLIDRSVAVAAGGARAATDCPDRQV